jgi:vacuolar-type H+-ATPase subunit E/Vma4
MRTQAAIIKGLIERAASRRPQDVLHAVQKRAERTLLRAWNESLEAAMNQYLDWFTGLSSLPTDAEYERMQATEILRNATEDWYEEALGPYLEDVIKSFGVSKYWVLSRAPKKARREDAESIIKKLSTIAYPLPELGKSVSMSFSQMDVKALQWLTKDAQYWVTDKGKRVCGSIGEQIGGIVKGGMEEGFGRKEIGALLEGALGKMYERSDDYWTLVAAAGTVRSSSFGAVGGFEEAGVDEYEWMAMGDDRTCEICSMLNGKVFEVSRAVTKRDAVLASNDPEETKAIIPWLSLKAIEAASSLEAANVSVPPIHALCRCVINIR